MPPSNHYQTLQVSPQASAKDIKQAYRLLVKKFHPDSHPATIDAHEQMIRINAAYEILGDQHRRQAYDRQLATPELPKVDRQQRTAQAQQTQRHRTTGRDLDAQLHQWQQQVYSPINRLLLQMINSLEPELEALAADPFDQDLMEDFITYLTSCRYYHQKAQQIFQELPNPRKTAGVAADIYHCLNRISEGIEDLHWFTTSYDEHYLHTGQELFRIANTLRLDAQRSLRVVSGKS